MLVVRAASVALLLLLLLAVITNICCPSRPRVSGPSSPPLAVNVSQHGPFPSLRFLTFNVYGPFSVQLGRCDELSDLSCAQGSSNVRERLSDLVRYVGKYDVIAMQEVVGRELILFWS